MSDLSTEPLVVKQESETAAGAQIGGNYIRCTSVGKHPVPVLCRRLIREGVDPKRLAFVIRAGKPAYKQTATIESWAKVEVIRDTGGVFRSIPFKKRWGR